MLNLSILRPNLNFRDVNWRENSTLKMMNLPLSSLR